MSVWGDLLGMGEIAASPFDGGATLLPGILTTAGNLAPVLGGAAGGAAQQQNTNYGLNLQRLLYMLEAPQARLDQSKKASMLADFQPTKVTLGPRGSGQVAQFSGGFNNPNLYNPDTVALANNITHNNLLASLNGTDAVPPPNASTTGGLLGGAALGSGILGALGAGYSAGANNPNNPNAGWDPWGGSQMPDDSLQISDLVNA